MTALFIISLVIGVAGAVLTDTWVRRRWRHYMIWPSASWLMVWGTLVITVLAREIR